MRELMKTNMAAGYLLLELFRQSITLWLEFLMICGCSIVYFVSYMAPFRWPNIQNDLALAKEVAARKPQTHQDWDEIASVPSGVFIISSDSNRVDLKGRRCRERLAPPCISPSKYRPPKLVTQKTLR